MDPLLRVNETLQFADKVAGGKFSREVEQTQRKNSQCVNLEVTLLEALKTISEHYQELVASSHNCKITILGDTTAELKFKMNSMTLLDEISTGLDSAATFDIGSAVWRRSDSETEEKWHAMDLCKDPTLLQRAGALMCYQQSFVKSIQTLLRRQSDGFMPAPNLQHRSNGRISCSPASSTTSSLPKFWGNGGTLISLLSSSFSMRNHTASTGIVSLLNCIIFAGFIVTKGQYPRLTQLRSSKYVLKGITGFALPESTQQIRMAMGSSGSGKARLLVAKPVAKLLGRLRG